MTRDEQVLIYLIAGLTAALDGIFVIHLGVIDVKILGQVQLRSLDELQVTRTGENHLHRNGIIGGHFGGAYVGTDAEIPHSAVERLALAGGQRLHVKCNPSGYKIFLYVYVAS